MAHMIIQELQETGIVSVACKKVGLSRQSLYRWKEEDPDFSDRIDEAILMGVSSINDLSESKLVTNINKGDQRAIEFQLKNNHPRYRPKKPDTSDERRLIPVTSIEHDVYTENSDKNLKPDIQL